MRYLLKMGKQSVCKPMIATKVRQTGQSNVIKLLSGLARLLFTRQLPAGGIYIFPPTPANIDRYAFAV